MKTPSIVWFRRDLRLADNPAIDAAVRRGGPVIPVFILDETSGVRSPGAAARWWLEKSILALSADIERRGARLIMRRGEASAVISELIEETGAGAVYWNRLYDPGVVERDKRVKAEVRSRGVLAQSFKSYLLTEPWEVRTKAGGFYSVFTPFWRAARPIAEALIDADAQKSPMTAPDRWPSYQRSLRSETVADLRLYPRKATWALGFKEWTPGELGAHRALNAFVDGPLARYKTDRDGPDRLGTSRLSPHLHWGEVSPAAVWRAAQQRAPESDLSSLEGFFTELGWREFNHHLLFERPDLEAANFRPQFDAFPWRSAPDDFRRWTRGETGYPLVDAGMRELWRTGFMHNRVRMVAASFLVKHLLLDWRLGEAWFWDTLLDASPASNVLNWQWVAGCGADAAPFFRIFSPSAQAARFDPEARYVKRWVPELASWPAKWIHAPGAVPPVDLSASGVRLGETYPRPLVDHDEGRRRALAAFKGLGTNT